MQMTAPCCRLVVMLFVVALEKVNVPLNGTRGVDEFMVEGRADCTRTEGEKVPLRVM